jgi:hypothetical protein
MRHGVILFFVQCLLNFVGTVNLIATAQFNYLWTILSDIMIAILGFTAIKQIAEKGDGVPKIIGFTLGAVLGSVLGIFVSKMIL